MLARSGHIELPPPGGDVIGRRRVDTHILALEKLGANVSIQYNARGKGKIVIQYNSLDELDGILKHIK